MRHLLFNLIAAYIYHTPFRPGRSILGRLAYRIYPHEFVAEVTSGIKIKVRLDWASDITYWTNSYENHDELKVFLSHLREGMTVLDIGANIGFYALHFARKVGPSGKVYAFEPVPEFFERLKEHIALNNMTNIFPIHVALSDQKGSAKMSV
ncbi:MAG: FkbM family methyltransferase, partial [Aquificaceae bacterium]|nr:FkbM family methyltransferase [Aquificaceae bacterium]